MAQRINSATLDGCVLPVFVADDDRPSRLGSCVLAHVLGIHFVIRPPTFFKVLLEGRSIWAARLQINRTVGDRRVFSSRRVTRRFGPRCDSAGVYWSSNAEYSVELPNSADRMRFSWKGNLGVAGIGGNALGGHRQDASFHRPQSGVLFRVVLRTESGSNRRWRGTPHLEAGNRLKHTARQHAHAGS
jgi:hypothetical protein